jgi:hypothetical protein
VRDERSDLEALVPREVARADRLESAVKKSNTSSAVVTSPLTVAGNFSRRAPSSRATTPAARREKSFHSRKR